MSEDDSDDKRLDEIMTLTEQVKTLENENGVLKRQVQEMATQMAKQEETTNGIVER